MHPRRDLRCRILLALFAGLVITVLISWVAMLVPYGAHGYGPRVTDDLGLAWDEDQQRYWQIERGSNAWNRVVQYWWMQISGMSFSLPTEDYEARRFDFESLRARFRPRSLGDLVMLSWYYETGWPFGAMTCSVHWKTQVANADIIYRVEGGLQLPRDSEFHPRAIPLTPVWPGFAIDVLIWAGAWMTIAWACHASRARWREKRNRCPFCGYPRTGLPAGSRCPECGGGNERTGAVNS